MVQSFEAYYMENNFFSLFIEHIPVQYQKFKLTLQTMVQSFEAYYVKCRSTRIYTNWEYFNNPNFYLLS